MVCKRFFLLSLVVLTSLAHVNAQSFSLDTSFGSSSAGYQYVAWKSKKMLHVNGNYYYLGSNVIAKTDYSGVTASAFGTNGYKLVDTDFANPLLLVNFTYKDGFFYLYGSKGGNIVIVKVTEAGNYDNTFGVNGKVVLDFGGQDKVNDVFIDDNGALFGVGQKTNSLCYFKVTPQGQADTSFDANGYKILPISDDSQLNGHAIRPYQGGFLLMGSANYASGTGKLLIAKIDVSGNLDTSFGNNGYQLTTLEVGSYTILLQVDLSGNQVYASYYWNWSQSSGSRVIKLNLDTGELAYKKGGIGTETYFALSGDYMYLTGFWNCSSGNSCGRKFYLVRRFEADGTTDSSFFDGGLEYHFNYPIPQLSLDDISTAIMKDDNGALVIAGYHYALTDGTGAVLRVVEGPLSSSESGRTDLALFPNPFTDKLYLSAVDQTVQLIEVYDLSGRLLGRPAFDSGLSQQIAVDMQLLSTAGMYMLRVITKEGQYNYRIIKKG